MNSIYDYTLEELKGKLKPSFRAKQVYNWLYKKYASSYDDMKNLPKDLIADLKENYPIDILEIIKKEKSLDGSIKYLFRLRDGHTVEAVLLLMKKKTVNEDGVIEKSEKFTVCISTQVGCKVGCSFCLTAKGGFVRNLSVGEIVNQIVQIKRDNQIPENKTLNIVYMGMGEPLDNYNNFVHSVKVFSEEDGLSINRRRQTVSTSGLSTKIEKLANEELGIQLAISLHAVDDDLRSELIPMNKAYDDIESAKKLLKLLDGIKAKVNLIYFNPYPGTSYQRPQRDDMLKFQEYLTSRGLLCTIRESKGLDISAACGQLKEKEANGSS